MSSKDITRAPLGERLAAGTRASLVLPAIGLLSLVLLAPAAWTGRTADDYLHQLMLRDPPGVRGLEYRPLDLFRFADGNAETSRALVSEGVFPWWADPEARIAFFRPLSSATHWLDAALWPSQTVAMHLHSLAWFALLLACVAALYRSLGGAAVPTWLAFALFALDDAHAPAVGWIANRNALISASLALLSLTTLHRHRTRGGRGRAWLSPTLLALGLLAGETAIAGAAYLVAYALCFGRGRPGERLAMLIPHAGVVAAWKLACIGLGYGARGSGVYLDPFTEPMQFLTAGIERFLALSLSLLAAPFADLWEVYPLVAPDLQGIVLLASGVVLGSVTLALAGPLSESAELRFLCLGAVLSLVPLCATFPHDRLLLLPGVGAMPALAALLSSAWRERRRLAPALGGGVLSLVHVVASSVLLPLRAASVGDFDELLRASERSLASGPSLRDQTLVLLNPALDPLAAYLPLYRAATGRPRPARQLWLGSGATDAKLRTLDRHRLKLCLEGGFLAFAGERMLRRPGSGLEPGERVSVAGGEILVTDQTADGRPRCVIVRFDLPLSDPGLVFLRWSGSGYAPLRLPPPGESVVLPRADIGRLLFRGWVDDGVPEALTQPLRASGPLTKRAPLLPDVGRRALPGGVPTRTVSRERGT